MQIWDYAIMTDSSAQGVFVNGGKVYDAENSPKRFELLNQLGDQGWELVAVTSVFVQASNEAVVTMYLKRPKAAA